MIRLGQKTKLNLPYEGTFKQKTNNEAHRRFVAQAKKELLKYGLTMCFTKEQVMSIMEELPVKWEYNPKWQEFYLELEPLVVIKVMDEILYIPLSTPIRDLPKGEVLEYYYGGTR